VSDRTTTKLLEVLVDRHLLPVKEATAIQKKLTGEPGELERLLVEHRLVDEETFANLRAQVLGVPYVNLREKVISKDVLNIVPETTAREHLIVAYEQTPRLLRVAMVEPTDRQIVEFIHKKVDLPVEVALASRTAVRDALSRYHESLESDLKGLIDEEKKRLTAIGDLNQASREMPIITVVDAILRQAILQRASDIHIEPLEDKVIVRYRIDGLLNDKLVLDESASPALVARIKVLSGLKIDEHRLPQDGRFKIETEDYRVSFRVSILPVFDGEKVVMRLLDESGSGLALDEMDFRSEQRAMVNRAIERPHGLILVTGPTGSGKTTTLYAMMRKLNTPDVNISTIEDPIEYRMPRINQTQVKPQIGLTFANGLRALVRQDPDIIMVGEIRDQETAALAINAALTGHLVLSTLHTNSAAGAVPRLIDMKVESFLLASTLNLVMAQRLVRRLCDKCRKQIPLSQEMLDTLAPLFDLERLLTVLRREGVVNKTETLKDITLFQANGCTACHQGYRGRLGIYEFLEVTPSIQELITARGTAQAIEEAARKQQNMITMLEDGFLKIVSGVTTIEEVLRVAQE
jgi:type IV pilus assembly protein PilB